MYHCTSVNCAYSCGNVHLLPDHVAYSCMLLQHMLALRSNFSVMILDNFVVVGKLALQLIQPVKLVPCGLTVP